MNRVAQDFDDAALELPKKTGAVMAENDFDMLASQVSQGGVGVDPDSYLEVVGGAESDLEFGSDDTMDEVAVAGLAAAGDDNPTKPAAFDETLVDLLGDVEGVVGGDEAQCLFSIAEKSVIPAVKLDGVSDDDGDSVGGKRKREEEHAMPLYVAGKLRIKNLGWQMVWASLNDDGHEFVLESARQLRARVVKLTEIKDRKLEVKGETLPAEKPYVYASALKRVSREEKTLITALHPRFKEGALLGKNAFGNLAPKMERRGLHGLRSARLRENGAIYFYLA